MVEPAFANSLERVRHIIVIYQENWSFDSLYGKFPGANGFADSFPTIPQIDLNGNPICELPQPIGNNGAPDPRFPANLPVLPYDMTYYVPADQRTGDIIHRFYHEWFQIDGGKMDKFVTWSDNGGLVFSYIDATRLPEGRLAQQYVMCDNFFHSAFGGSFLNHQFLVAAAAPPWNQPLPTSSSRFVSSYNPTNNALVDGNLTIDAQFAVNTTFTANTPHPASAHADQLMQSINDADPTLPFYVPTIGDRLSEQRISWKWYSGGWSNALAGNPDPLFQFHHQPFAYYANYADGTPGKSEHLQDEQDFFNDLAGGTLPRVSFIKPIGRDNEHPGYATLVACQMHVAELVRAVQRSQFWANCAIIVTYDENGGRWDHVSPPLVDAWGPGTRVPAIIISPFAKKGRVDHTQYEPVSILKFIEKRFGLAPLSPRDANPAVNDLSNAFEFGVGFGWH